MQGFTGLDCGLEKEPSGIFLTKVRVDRFPTRTETGSAWDLVSGADIYIVIKYAGEVVYMHPSFIENAPLGKTHFFEIQNNFSFNEPLGRYEILLYDFDDLDSDDLMGGIEFIPYRKGDLFPREKTLDTIGNVAFEVSLEYVL